MATATRGDIWFLLEYPYRWGAKAFDESELPETVKAHLNTAEHPDLKLRIQMVRQGESLQRDEIHFFVAQPCLDQPRIDQYVLNDYQDLLKLDLKALAAGQAGPPANLREEPLFLVCTNGKRDLCCARYGPALYQAMQAAGGEAVWQSSHIGGHNKAPVNLFFPHGVHYGQITPEEVGDVMEAFRQDRLVLDHYRGRVCFEPHLQAAEHLWREQSGVRSLPGMKFGAAQQIQGNAWRVEIEAADGSREVIDLERELSDFEIPVTCAGDKTSPIATYRLKR